MHFVSQCSKDCGGGVHWRKVICMRSSDRTEINPLFCAGQRKPDMQQPCNTQECSAWSTSDWSEVKFAYILVSFFVSFPWRSDSGGYSNLGCSLWNWKKTFLHCSVPLRADRAVRGEQFSAQRRVTNMLVPRTHNSATLQPACRGSRDTGLRSVQVCK